VLIEWPERLATASGTLLPRDRLLVTLSIEGDGRRAIIEGDSRFDDL
jgi:tRNA A37 threonylcarbamoyladenosine biosynthesis protein TsaE